MSVLRDHQQLAQVAQPDIKTIFRQRFHEICDPEPYDPDEHGFFDCIYDSAGHRIEMIWLSKLMLFNLVDFDPKKYDSIRSICR